ncbi:hypothetical protein [Wenjunlia tyrosinilytica]|uniref:Uncharacterized protein n=1 Tax=Wenjunlia tyrosinilytica TaxID=1544741 RepID=A0A918E3A2_9ACTN|nr:hypothetical protein [Wenjunlia tyrosinilytica]GGP01119.1 hypothetical protein GCM10012280_71340 [Wenjunlia tyrosinilytica]
MSEAPPERQNGPGPQAVLRLPDGQSLHTTVSHRFQEADGSWWYDVEVTLWNVVIDRSGIRTAEPYPITIRVAADNVSPIDGQDYRTVPTTRSHLAVKRSRSGGRRIGPSAHR